MTMILQNNPPWKYCSGSAIFVLFVCFQWLFHNSTTILLARTKTKTNTKTASNLAKIGSNLTNNHKNRYKSEQQQNEKMKKKNHTKTIYFRHINQNKANRKKSEENRILYVQFLSNTCDNSKYTCILLRSNTLHTHKHTIAAEIDRFLRFSCADYSWISTCLTIVTKMFFLSSRKRRGRKIN